MRRKNPTNQTKQNRPAHTMIIVPLWTFGYGWCVTFYEIINFIEVATNFQDIFSWTLILRKISVWEETWNYCLYLRCIEWNRCLQKLVNTFHWTRSFSLVETWSYIVSKSEKCLWTQSKMFLYWISVIDECLHI